MNKEGEKRENVTTKKFMDWDKYKGKEPSAAAESIYAHISDFATTTTGWYWKSIKTKRLASLTMRIASFILLVVGTFLQLLASAVPLVQDRLETTQSGIAFLAIAALLLVADRAFGLSGGWMRYIVTVTTMENLVRAFQMEWAKFFVSKVGDIDTNDVKSLFTLAESLEQELLKLQGDETTKWVTEFNAGIALLESSIKAQRDESEKRADVIRTTLASQEATAKADQKTGLNGALELALVHVAEIKKVQIRFDLDPPLDFVGTSWAKLDVKPGQHIVQVNTIEAPVQTVFKVVDIQPSVVAKIEVKFAK